MSDMEKNESIERYVEGLKCAADCLRQIGAAQKNRQWNKIAFNLDGLLQKGQAMYRSKALGRQEALSMIDNKVKTMQAAEQNGG